MRKPTAELTAVLRAANYWGISPEDMATLLMKESSMNPRKIGGEGNVHHGLFQMNPWNRRHMAPGLRQQLGLEPKPGVLDLGFVDQVRLMVVWVEQQHQNLEQEKRRDPELRQERNFRDRWFSQMGQRIHWIYNTINPSAYGKTGDSWGTRGVEVFAANSRARRWAREWLQRNGYVPGMEQRPEYDPVHLNLPPRFRQARLYNHLAKVPPAHGQSRVVTTSPSPSVVTRGTGVVPPPPPSPTRSATVVPPPPPLVTRGTGVVPPPSPSAALGAGVIPSAAPQEPSPLSVPLQLIPVQELLGESEVIKEKENATMDLVIGE